MASRINPTEEERKHRCSQYLGGKESIVEKKHCRYFVQSQYFESYALRIPRVLAVFQGSVPRILLELFHAFRGSLLLLCILTVHAVGAGSMYWPYFVRWYCSYCASTRGTKILPTCPAYSQVSSSMHTGAVCDGVYQHSLRPIFQARHLHTTWNSATGTEKTSVGTISPRAFRRRVVRYVTLLALAPSLLVLAVE